MLHNFKNPPNFKTKKKKKSKCLSKNINWEENKHPLNYIKLGKDYHPQKIDFDRFRKIPISQKNSQK